jgi:hypothetical protein
VAALGFEKCKLAHGGLAGFFWNPKLIERLKTRYYPPSSNLTPLTPQTPLSPARMENKALDQDMKAGESGEKSPKSTISGINQNAINAGECRENRESGVSLEGRPSVQEVLERVRAVFVEGTEEEWVKHAIENGLSEKEAFSLFESLKGSELFWFQSDGQTFWRWVRE